MKGMLWNMGIGEDRWRLEPWEIAGR